MRSNIKTIFLRLFKRGAAKNISAIKINSVPERRYIVEFIEILSVFSVSFPNEVQAPTRGRGEPANVVQSERVDFAWKETKTAACNSSRFAASRGGTKRNRSRTRPFGWRERLSRRDSNEHDASGMYSTVYHHVSSRTRYGTVKRRRMTRAT